MLSTVCDAVNASSFVARNWLLDDNEHDYYVYVYYVYVYYYDHVYYSSHGLRVSEGFKPDIYTIIITMSTSITSMSTSITSTSKLLQYVHQKFITTSIIVMVIYECHSQHFTYVD